MKLRVNCRCFVYPSSSRWAFTVTHPFLCTRACQGTANFGRINFDRQQLLIQKLGLRVRSLPLVLSVSRREMRLMDRVPTSTAEVVRFAASVLPDKHVTVLRSRQAADKWLDERDRQVRAQRTVPSLPAVAASVLACSMLAYASRLAGKRRGASAVARGGVSADARRRQVRVVLMSEDRWPAYWSLAAAPALEGRFAFAFMPARAAQDLADKFGVDIEPPAGGGEGARVVVVVRRDGSHAAKTGVQSRKALTRFLLKNQWELVPQARRPAPSRVARGAHESCGCFAQ